MFQALSFADSLWSILFDVFIVKKELVVYYLNSKEIFSNNVEVHNSFNSWARLSKVKNEGL